MIGSKAITKAGSNCQTILKSQLRNFSSLKSPCLTRDFIHDRLYNPNGGYFCQKNVQIGELSEPINFKELLGYEQYTRELSEKYPKNAWLTPSELFRPWYGFTIANYIHQVYIRQTRDGKKPKLKIIEAGAGAGSAAEAILFFFKNYEAQLYSTMDYKIVDLSPQMCERAAQKLSVNHKRLLDRGQIKIINDSILNYSERDDTLTFVLFLEVFDNMPHDRIYYSDDKKDWAYETLVETLDQGTEKESYKEIKQAISDPFVREMVDIYRSMPESDYYDEAKATQGMSERLVRWMYRTKDTKNVFLPTVTLKMLKNIQRVLPGHHLIAADFDGLRDAQSVHRGINHPIISKKLERSHEKHDYQTYLVGRGEADIFFPTDFQLISTMYKHVCNRKSTILKTHEFVDEFAKEKWCETKSGYNPLKEDFLNTSIITSDRF